MGLKLKSGVLPSILDSNVCLLSIYLFCQFEGNALAAAFASSGRANVDISEFGEDRCFCCSLPTTDISLLAATLGINLFDFCFENDLSRLHELNRVP